ncbi:MAG: hypothetical protein JSS49_09655 [Planctomycetes bacterium]|nr:hypothetical protein [Planctomycetota bacterium]
MLRMSIAGVMLLLMNSSLLLAQDATKVRELSLVWELPTPRDMPQAIVEDGLKRPLLFAAMKTGGLVVVNIANRKQAPKEVARLGVDQFHNLQVMHLTQSGEHLYLALGDLFNSSGAPAGLAVVNVKNAQRPRVVARWKSDEVLQGSATVLVDDGFAYLGAMSAGVIILDVSQPDRIERISSYQPNVDFPSPNPSKIHHPNARGFAKRGDLLYVAYDAGGLRVLDVSKPREPREIGRYVNRRFPNKPQAFNNLVLDDHRAYVAVDYAGLEILDIRNPRDIKQLGWWNPWGADALSNIWFNSAGHTNQIAWNADKKQVWLSAGDSELQVVDVSKPTQPKLVARYGAPRNKQGAWGVTLAGDRAYLTYINAVVPFQGTWSGIKAVE